MDFDELVSEYHKEKEQEADTDLAAEIAQDLETLTVSISGLVHGGKVLALRVFVDNHRCQRYMTTAEQDAKGIRNPAQVAVMHLNRRLAWLQGYTWSFDQGSKTYGQGVLTPPEVEKITELARAEFERNRARIEEQNGTSTTNNIGATPKAEVGAEAD